MNKDNEDKPMLAEDQIDTQPADGATNCGAIDGVAIGRGTEQVVTTQFANESCSAVDVRGAHRVPPPEYYNDSDNVSDIKSYFARPRVVDTLVYNQTASTVIKTHQLDNDTIQTLLPNSFQRLQGAYGWRGTIVFRLQAIAQPFQAGRVRLAYEPYGNSSVWNRVSALTPVSQLPGIDLDLAETTEAVLKIPFIHPRSYFSVKSGVAPSAQNLGRLVVFAYTPVALAASAVAPNLLVWMYIEDLETIGADAISLQSGDFKKKKSNAAAEENAIPGNLSNVLMAGSKLVSWLGPKIPLLSAVSGQVSWAVRESAKIAASYGWSKPAITSPVTRMQNTDNAYQFNMDGPDIAYSLAAAADNAVEVYSGFAGTDIDEMAMRYLTSVYAGISVPSLANDDTVGKVVYSCPVTPNVMYKQPYSGYNQDAFIPNYFSIWPSPLKYLSNAFTLWRGGIKFRLKISKTKFHTGRIILGFVPWDPNSSNSNASNAFKPFVPADITSLQYKSVILDLREQNVIEFVCPFLCPYPFVKRSDSIGTFFVAVVEPLAGPDTVATTIPFIVEVAGGDDIEFAAPSLGPLVTSPIGQTYFSQSGDFEPYNVPFDDSAGRRAIGERINSIKQLISRACPHNILNNSIDINRNSGPYFPKFIGSDPPTGLDAHATWFDYFGAMFGLYRGSMVYHNIGIGGDTTVGGYYKAAFGNDLTLDNTYVVENRTGAHVRLPYYSPTTRSICYASEAGTGADFDIPISSAVLTSSNATANSAGSVYSYRAGDDFQFGYFVCAPPLTPWQVTGSTILNAQTTIQTALQSAH